MRQYETIFIINPELDESETTDVIEGVKATLESSGGKILKADLWGKKKLAYTIKQHNDGYYVLLVFESGPELVRQLNDYYQITEPIIKYIVIQFEGVLTTAAPRHVEEPQVSESDEDAPDDN